jgi:hypothetical protein
MTSPHPSRPALPVLLAAAAVCAALVSSPAAAGTEPAAGRPVDDDSSVTYVTLGGAFPQGLKWDPTGALYLWRAPETGESRLRAMLTGIANEARWDHRIGRQGGLAWVASLDSLTLPWERAEVVQGTELLSSELKWSQARAGIGVALHGPLGARESYNGIDGALTVEVGGLWFAAGPETASTYVLPTDTLETRLHFRFRADALERNLLALPVRGWSAGLDGNWGVRNRWDPWGDPAAGLKSDGRTWLALTAFAYGAFPFPGLPAEHRLIPSFHAGIGSDLDRFSAFRLGSGTTWGDFETLSRAVVPAAGMEELASARYLTADLEYRAALLPYLFLQLRGTLAWVDRPVAVAGGYETRTGTFPAVTAGVTSGLPWDSAIEVGWSWNFGLENAGDGGATKGRSGLMVTFSKVF